MIRTAVLAALFAVTLPISAIAQSTAAAGATGAQAPEALAEIVITAQRRAENLDRVPIAATVIQGADLGSRGVLNLDDLGGLAPGLNVQNQQAEAYVNIRGVGLQSINPTTSSGVANYSDGFFIPHETAILDAYFDVGQIEVLKGPQGTLVGQNSTGGAILVNSVRPSFERVTGFVEQSFGDYSLTQTQGAINLPVSDHFAIERPPTSIAETAFTMTSTSATIRRQPIFNPAMSHRKALGSQHGGSRRPISTCI